GTKLLITPDLDQVEALNPEREALWERLNAATFLTDDEKRAAAGYGAKGEAPASAKFNPYHDDAGRFTTADGVGSGGQDAGKIIIAQADEFSPKRSGWHDYTQGPTTVCAAELRCSVEEMRDQLPRYAVPGQNHAEPVEDRGVYTVYDPRNGLPAGYVTVSISPDGLTIINKTRPLHVLYNGQIQRSAQQMPDGSWVMTTRGIGNNVFPGFNKLNEWQGPKIFDTLDQQLTNNIRLHHGLPGSEKSRDGSHVKTRRDICNNCRDGENE
ncbi:MAG: hypothetical protein ABL893_18750, partial [Hyphomicrobium sp.]